MSVSLAEALRDVDLRPGHTYRCQIRGHNVELRVLGAPENIADSESAISAADAMLEPWIELPEPVARARGVSRLGQAMLPDPPAIPD
jgi:hypothetical protein